MDALSVNSTNADCVILGSFPAIRRYFTSPTTPLMKSSSCEAVTWGLIFSIYTVRRISSIVFGSLSADKGGYCGSPNMSKFESIEVITKLPLTAAISLLTSLKLDVSNPGKADVGFNKSNDVLSSLGMCSPGIATTTKALSMKTVLVKCNATRTLHESVYLM